MQLYKPAAHWSIVCIISSAITTRAAFLRAQQLFKNKYALIHSYYLLGPASNSCARIGNHRLTSQISCHRRWSVSRPIHLPRLRLRRTQSRPRQQHRLRLVVLRHDRRQRRRGRSFICRRRLPRRHKRWVPNTGGVSEQDPDDPRWHFSERNHMANVQFCERRGGCCRWDALAGQLG